MSECYRCGISGERTRLFDAISGEGIVKLCSNCSGDENIPVIKRPTDVQLYKAEKGPSVYERLSRVVGVDPKEHKEQFGIEGVKKKEERKSEEITLRSIVDRNYERRMEDKGINIEKKQTRTDLIHNFHWIIMRSRRMRKLTQKQLAEKIGESELAIKMAEQGTLALGDNKLVKKLEDFLGIRIVRDELRAIEEKNKATLEFDEMGTKTITIADLRELKAEHDTKTMIGEIEEDEDLNKGFKLRLGSKEDEPEFG
ncbi:MAG: hypothetical protein KKB31_01530 [Nanoarchaeota archaeon]|nr:hypothetical protein [Nanoarchaeota archaeon]